MRLIVARLLLFLITSVPAGQTAKCPRVCVCDDTKLTVTCVRKNLTHIPPTINEVSVTFHIQCRTPHKKRHACLLISQSYTV